MKITCNFKQNKISSNVNFLIPFCYQFLKNLKIHFFLKHLTYLVYHKYCHPYLYKSGTQIQKEGFLIPTPPKNLVKYTFFSHHNKISICVEFSPLLCERSPTLYIPKRFSWIPRDVYDFEAANLVGAYFR